MPAESKLQNLQQIAWLIAAVAVIFGAAGAWGWKLLLEAKAELDGTGRRVTQLTADVSKLEPVMRGHVASLQQAGAEQLKKFREEAKHDSDAASDIFRKEVASISLPNEIKT
jgi:hypothetical protein